ncbi:MAG TPA: hypothetical protein VGE01_11565, partial [Fimbriimonas sp.]
EGNVRVRGVIPTDVQLSLVSMGTIYIEGSLTKGVVGNHVTAGYPQGFVYPTVPVGNRLGRPSRSMLLLAAKEYVAVNPTMFFGPSGSSNPQILAGAGNYESIRIPQGSAQGFVTDFALDPSNGQPYAAGYYYRDTDGTQLPIPTRLVMTHTMAEGPASATFISANVNEWLGAPSAYNFPRTATDWTDPSVAPYPPLAIFSNNLAANLNLAGDPTHSLLYGLGGEQYQRYSNFETVGFPIVNNTSGAITVTNETIQSDVTPGFTDDLFTLVTQGARQPVNQFVVRPNSAGGYATNDYLLARAALVPHDVRIEAVIFAEEGSFFVIPGQWFNANPNDTRAAYDAYRANNGGLASDAARQVADVHRLETFGSSPITPFYGEPIDVRIQIVGAVSENMPPSMSQQAEWIRKWGWMPRQLAAMYHYGKSQPVSIPEGHVLGTGFESRTEPFVPNLTINYDPVLATARAGGFAATNDPFDVNSPAIRWDAANRPLPPIPRLPVSPTLAYFGEVK